MHASIASQSIGTRLLTSYARLSLPSQKELDQIRVSVTPLIDRFIDFGKRAYHKAKKGELLRKKGLGDVQEAMVSPGELENGSDQARREESKHKEDFSAYWAKQSAHGKNRNSKNLSVTDSSPNPGLFERRVHEAPVTAAENCDVDRQKHFQRFLKEQQRWLSYDAYARTCMSLGMNQLLQALAYYVVGTIAEFSYIAALTSFLGVKYLALLLLRLDLCDGFRSSWEKIAVMMTFVMPPLLAACVIWLPPEVSMLQRELLVCPCFLLHGGWALYCAYQVQPLAPEGVAENEDAEYSVALLPRRWRAVQYLNVLDTRQRSIAREVNTQGLKERIDELKNACEELNKEMESVQRKEQAEGSVSIASRCSSTLQRLREHVETYMARMLLHGNSTALSAAKEAQQLLDRCEVWQKTPDVLASLEALRNREVQLYLDDEQKRSIELSYQAFLHCCQELELGVLQEQASDAPEAGLSALSVDRSEEPTVRLDTYWDSLPQSVWLDLQSDSVKTSTSRPDYHRATSMRSALEVSLPNWTSQALQIRAGQQETAAQELTVREHPSTSQANVQEQSEEPSLPGDEGRASGNEDDDSVVLPPPLVPAESMPPDQLPGQVVLKFTLCTALFWFLMTIAYTITSACNLRPKLPSLKLLHTVQVAWPEPANFFEVQALHCNSSHLLASGRYATFTARRSSRAKTEEPAVGSFVQLSGNSASAVVCAVSGDAGCHTLAQRRLDLAGDSPGEKRQQSASNVSPWLLTSLGESSEDARTLEHLPLPRSWRAVAAAPFEACVDVQGQPVNMCRMQLAGWDGSGIEIASLRWQNASSVPILELRFALRPGLGRCSDPGQGWHVSGCDQALIGPQSYDEVQALHLSSNAAVLLVLLRSGFLDVWHLATGEMLGRWLLTSQQQGANYTALCHDGTSKELLLAVRGAPGTGAPTLLTAALPDVLQQRLGLAAGDCTHGQTTSKSASASALVI
eukprot:TRINITY_DN28070_c0_g1_i1.p1 TRINITY_DN28070_c0_g1~~TRINITY_DN28070_c0_g1_i1.p1  ORF type:complete len:1090 (+),score=195.35 TRINITY_DN28070_c0_g1_i1:358-3270(+)